MAITSDSSICSYFFFINQGSQALTAAYAADPFDFNDQSVDDGVNFISKGIIIANDSGASIFFSFDGTDDHGEVLAGEVLTFDWLHKKSIFIRGSAGGESYRFWAW